MPAVEALTPRGVQFRAWLPSVLRDSPDYLAVLHCRAREFELMESRIEQVRAQFFPQTADILLKVWEAQLGITIEPEGETLLQRRNTVVAMLRKLKATPSGLDWQANVTRLVGPGWSYAEHNPDDPTSPPAYTIRVQLPFPPTSALYARTERLLRDITPAHEDLVLNWTGGFRLDESELDQEGFGA